MRNIYNLSDISIEFNEIDEYSRDSEEELTDIYKTINRIINSKFCFENKHIKTILISWKQEFLDCLYANYEVNTVLKQFLDNNDIDRKTKYQLNKESGGIYWIKYNNHEHLDVKEIKTLNKHDFILILKELLEILSEVI